MKQISLYGTPTQQFLVAPPCQQPRCNNAKKGGRQTVYPIKTDEELRSMAAWLRANQHPKYFLAFVLGINIGLRANELLSLKVRDVVRPDRSIKMSENIQDMNDGISIWQSKNQKNRQLFLNNDCVKALRYYFDLVYDGYPPMDEDLFPSREGGHLEVGTLRDVLKKAAKECGIRQNIGTHTLRKTFGYRHYQKFGNIEHLRRLFCHSSSLVTLRYIGIAEEEDKAAYHAIDFGICDML